MLGRKAFHKFNERLMQAHPDDRFETGIMYDPDKGWRPYQRIGNAVLILPPEVARALTVTAREEGRKPRNLFAWTEIGPIYEALSSMADECDQKNRDKIVPSEALDHMQPRGSA